jgi:putative hydrolase of HD superfamily
MDNLESLTNFFVEVNTLKKTVRYSSCPEKIQESTAGHCWQVTLMVPILAREFGLNVDIQHAMEIANVHDLAEYVLKEDYDSFSVAMDILSAVDKDKSEEYVMSSLKNRFSFGHQLYSLWEEYQECKTPEARFVKALDKIESHLHIIERGGTANSSRDALHQVLYADDAVRNFPQLEPFLKIVKKKLRPLMEAQGLIWKEEYNYPD